MLSKVIMFLKSTQPAITQGFYESLGLSWKKAEVLSSTFSWTATGNLFLVLPSKPYKEATIRFYGIDKSNNILDRFPSSEEKMTQETKQIVEGLLDFFPKAAEEDPQAIIPVLRVEQIELLHRQWASFGNWKLEKHGKGPLHYALEQPDLTIEIYPKRKIDRGPIELVFMNFEIDTSKILPHCTVNDSERSSLLLDPNGVIVNILKSEVPQNAPNI